eukprot:COSAG02_NODE_331_length_24480_cov_22.114720_16_plen_63_part_00
MRLNVTCQNHGQGLGFKVTVAGVVDKQKLKRLAGLLATGVFTVYPYLVATMDETEETSSEGS